MRDLDLLVMLLVFVPAYAYPLMTASWAKPAARHWRMFAAGTTAAVTAAIFLVVTGASGAGPLLWGVIGGVLAGLYEQSWGPEGSPGD